MSFKPLKRYTCLVAFNSLLDTVVLVHKLRPEWQKGKANFPGGKVEVMDYWHASDCVQGAYPFYCRPPKLPDDAMCCGGGTEGADNAYLRCVVREAREETGLEISPGATTYFCSLRFGSKENASEVRFFATVVNVDNATTMEEERVFLAAVEDVASGWVHHMTFRDEARTKVSNVQSVEYPFMGPDTCIPTMLNLPWLVLMARSSLQHRTTSAFPMVIYEASAHGS